ncbi:PAT family beta-lactamase induction signal transducer AmpG [Dysgonomonas sp. PFB1-18]|nr:PAT family beta-lactamase induction signal transducer AmpG [Dysgonomonas sp. PF1-14]MDH6338582.1 PAT family beta-lactamase induction signal transducer AmpG [Dysgonomonas sp. PF1-16]MDH6379970.1 PAT family beta-lactamase induction signal transducer AmpG [Dysgonomonas sp. PFB1-18]MDH6397410.1 PAT family beta-lactamase induction signal transducer AmpG [Dysgonomonas sp. PF1-23]
MKENKKSPWAWIPSLYLAEGLPYVAVMTISVIMYKRMGISNTDIALYTSWLYLPWVIKPLWSPFVDLLKTKRWWIVTMQILIGAGFAGIAFTIPLPFFFQATLAFFWLLAFSSATHDIAADGFYMLGLNTNQQAKYVGIRSTFYRVATIMGQGVLIILAGFLESTSGLEPLKINIDASPQYTQSTLYIPTLSDTNAKDGEIHFILDRDNIRIGTQSVNKDSLDTFLKKVNKMNLDNGFVIKEAEKNKSKDGWWKINVSQPLGNWIKENFGEKRYVEKSAHSGNVAVAAVRLSKQPEQGKEMVLNTTMNRGDNSISLLHGERLAFNEANWNKTAYLVFQIDPKLNTASTAEYKGLSGNIPFAWSITFFVLAGLFIVFSFYHRVVLPKPDSDKSHAHLTAGSIMNEFISTFKSFFKKPQAAAAIFFMLTFRFSEAQILKLINPFLLDSRDIGGLGLTTGEVGLVYGTIGIIGLTLGGIIGGLVAAKGGLRKWLWPMTFSMLLTIATFLYLSFTQTESLILINICVFIEQFGYGFGFTAYMLYLMYYSDGEQKNSPLCHLYRFYGTRYDDTGYVCRMAARTTGLQSFLHLGDDMLHNTYYSSITAQNRS